MNASYARKINIFGAAALALISISSYTYSAANQAPQRKPPIEVQVTSLPSSPQPIHVAISSMPDFAAPEITVNVPPDDQTKSLVSTTRDLVRVTGAVALATLILAVATFWIGRKQSRDARELARSQRKDSERRARAAMGREANRAAYSVLVEATRLQVLSKEVPKAKAAAWRALGQVNISPHRQAQWDRDVEPRLATLAQMVKEAGFVVTDNPDVTLPLRDETDEQLTQRLWRLDTLLVRLGGMRESILQDMAAP